jgi:hypothetical protein
MLEHLKARGRANYGPGICKMSRVMEKLDQADIDTLNECLEDKDGYSTYGLWIGLKDAGVDVGYSTLDRHRKGHCPCEDA